MKLIILIRYLFRHLQKLIALKTLSEAFDVVITNSGFAKGGFATARLMDYHHSLKIVVLKLMSALRRKSLLRAFS